MSSTAAQLVRSTISYARPRLWAVPDRQQAVSRLPFILLVSVLLIGGVVGLLLFNTSMQQAAFSESKLQEQATNLAARQETLTMQIQRMQDPQAIAARAQRLGMVTPGTPAFLKVPSGKVEGKAAPADRSATPPLYRRINKPHGAQRIHSKTTADTPSGETAGRRTNR